MAKVIWCGQHDRAHRPGGVECRHQTLEESRQRFPCVLCGHATDRHNLDVGCPNCTCAATPGEARSNSHVKHPYEGKILQPGQYLNDRYRPVRKGNVHVYEVSGCRRKELAASPFDTRKDAEDYIEALKRQSTFEIEEKPMETSEPEVKGRFRIFEWISGVRHETPESPKPTLAEAQNYVARIDPAGRRSFEIIAPSRKPREVTEQEVTAALLAFWGAETTANKYGTPEGMRAALEAVEEYRA